MLKIYAFIQDGKVQNIVPCHGKEYAMENARLQYDNPSVVEIGTSKCDLMIGDKYENGNFYHFNHETEGWDKVRFVQETSSADVKKLQKEIRELKNMLKPSINVDDCLFEEYQDFRIGEAVYKFNEFLDNYFLSFESNGHEYLINASKDNWNSFVSNAAAQKMLVEYGINAGEFLWYDAEGVVFEMTTDEVMSVMKTWKDLINDMTVYMNTLVRDIRACTKKAEVKAISIDYNSVLA